MSVPGTYSSMYMSAGGGDVELIGSGGQVTGANTTTGITPTVNASTVNGDFVIIHASIRGVGGPTPSISTPSGWTRLTASHSGDVPVASSLSSYCFYRFYNGTMPLLVPGSSANMICNTTTWRNVNSLTPIDVTAVSDRDVNNRDFKTSTLTTVTPRTMIVVLAACVANTSSGNRFGTFSNSSLTSASELYDLSSSSVAMGEACYAGLKTTAGLVTSTTSLIVTSTSDDWTGFTVPLRPA